MSESESERDRECVFTDAAEDTDSATGRNRKRQLSVTEMAKNIEKKRNTQRKSPRKNTARSGESNPVTLDAIKSLIQAGNKEVIAAFEAKFATMQRKIEILEAENHDKSLMIEGLKNDIDLCQKENKKLTDQVKAIDMNRRLSSLILTCNEFKRKSPGENITAKTLEVLHQYFPDMELSESDFQVVHRLQGDTKVIAKFCQRRKRDDLYERRFDLMPGQVHDGRRAGSQTGSQSRRQMAPLFLSESLVPEHQRLYQLLLAAKRSENGAKVRSVFSRRGIVYCRKEVGGANIRVDSEQQLKELLGGRLPPLPSWNRD